MTSNGLDLTKVGAARFPASLTAVEVERIAELFGPGDKAGERLTAAAVSSVADLIVATGSIGSIARSLLGASARPVRGLLLDKSPHANWRLGWHQDRTISVCERRDVAGYGPWSMKAGQIHVQPPIELLAAMLTLRVHLDDVDEQNAPLEIIPGSHSLGRLDEPGIEALAEKSEGLTCLARSGDVWAYATPIVHRSAEQKRPGRRRVLQLDYAAGDLPGGLRWARLA